MHTPKFLGTSIFIEQLRWLLLKKVLVSEKNIKKKKVNGEIAFALIDLFHAQTQEPCKQVT